MSFRLIDLIQDNWHSTPKEDRPFMIFFLGVVLFLGIGFAIHVFERKENDKDVVITLSEVDCIANEGRVKYARLVTDPDSSSKGHVFEVEHDALYGCDFRYTLNGQEGVVYGVGVIIPLEVGQKMTVSKAFLTKGKS